MKDNCLKLNEIIIHAGIHKTGSTSIQDCLSNSLNQPLLTANNFLYPSVWPANHSIPVRSIFGKNPEAFHIHRRKNRNLQQIKALNKTYLEEIKTEVAETSQQKLIISGEEISTLDLAGLKQFKEFLHKTFNPEKITMIVFVRNPVSFKISNMQQIIGFDSYTLDSSFKVDLSRKGSSIKNKIYDLANVFGRNTVEVYSFEDAISHQMGSTGYFLSLLGFTEQEISKFLINKKNVSQSQFSIEMISYINQQYPLFKKDGSINSPRFDNDVALIRKIKGEKFDLDWEKKQKLHAIYFDEIVWLKDNYAIDYCSYEIKKNAINHEISDAQLQEIKHIYPKLSEIIQVYLIQYLKEILENGKDHYELQKLILDLEHPKRLGLLVKKLCSKIQKKLISAPKLG